MTSADHLEASLTAESGLVDMGVGLGGQPPSLTLVGQPTLQAAKRAPLTNYPGLDAERESERRIDGKCRTLRIATRLTE